MSKTILVLSTSSNTISKNPKKNELLKNKLIKKKPKSILCKDSKWLNHKDNFYKCAKYIAGIYIG